MSDQYLAANSEQVAAKIMDGEAILINLVTGMYYSMSDTGAFIWSLVEQGASMGAIAERMTAQFEVQLSRAQADLVELVRVLESEGLVCVSTQGSATTKLAEVVESRTPYVTPKLEKFTDMAEMFALDPPLPRIAEG
jgi:hypothetical protein